MPTVLDHSWRALTKPGSGESWFDADVAMPLPGDGAFDPRLAWWCAELSRLIYRHSDRGEILAQAGLRETCCISRAATHCAVVSPIDPTSPDATSYLVFRGSNELRNWISDLDTVPVAWPTGGRVHRGFVRALDRVWPELEARLAKLPGPIAYCGHSLGGAMATLAAARRPPDTLYTFGSPRVGNAAFCETLDGTPVHRVVNHHDLVTKVPPSIPPLKFTHVGELHAVSAEQENERAPRSVGGPPRPLADHAPINYVALLQRRLEPNLTGTPPKIFEQEQEIHDDLRSLGGHGARKVLEDARLTIFASLAVIPFACLLLLELPPDEPADGEHADGAHDGDEH